MTTDMRTPRAEQQGADCRCDEFRKCNCCGIGKPATPDFFAVSNYGIRTDPPRLVPICRDCVNRKARNGYIKKREPGRPKSYLCMLCKKTKANNEQNWCNGQTSKCRECFNEERRLAAKIASRLRAQQRREAREAKLLERAKDFGGNCGLCGNMSWRVRGPRCRKCALLYAPEPRPELETRRHFDYRCKL